MNKILGEEVEYPEYNAAAMGAGIEDMPYMSKYDACRYGWDCALDKMAENGPLYTAVEAPPAPDEKVVDDLEISKAALQRFHNKFMKRANIDPSTGYPEYGGQDDYYADLCAALDAVKALRDVPSDPRETGLSGDDS